MRRLLRAAWPLALAISLVATPAAAAPLTYPAPVQGSFPAPDPPAVTAASWILYDESADLVIAEHNADDERSIASVTKIMTGLLTIENSSPDELVTISERAANTGEKEIDLVAGETVTMDALFKALMIHSANDAATAIAEHISGSVEGFVDLMNQRADELGLDHSSFANPHGLDQAGHYSSARDLLVLSEVAMANPEFADVVRAKTMVFPEAPDGETRRGSSTNLLLSWYPGTIGVKTGFTNQALLTFAAVAERDGRRLYTVVLGSDGDRAHFADATALFNYGFEDLAYFGHVSTGTPYVAMQGRVEAEPLVVEGNMEVYMHLAGQGLMLDRPAPLTEEPEPAPPPIIEVVRTPASAPTSVLDAMGFWVGQAFGGE